MKKIDRSKQIEAVRNFCKALPDGKEFTICVLLMKGMPEKKIRSIVTGDIPRSLNLKNLRQGIPDVWSEQEEKWIGGEVLSWGKG